jgi:hypothetical protein
MKKPCLRVTKWLGDIPVEGSCTSCPDVTFKVTATARRPDREEYQKALTRGFEHHLKQVHSCDSLAKPLAES